MPALLRRRLLLTTFALPLAACGPRTLQFKGIDVTGADYGKALVATDHNGVKRSLGDFHGKLVALFFGFVQCPDVCPTTLSTMKTVKARLGAAGDRLQVLFMTIDPERDTPAVLKPYVTAFDPSFLGLYASPEDTAKAAKEFRVTYFKTDGPTPTSYGMAHTAFSYVIGANGQLRLMIEHAASAEDWLHDLKQLMPA